MNLFERWEAYQPTKTQAAWAVVGAVAATLVLGFGPGGWTSAGTASQRAADAAQEARHQLAAAVCVEDFMKAANARARLDKLHSAAYYQRADVVVEGGWATMPDRKDPDVAVAHMCAARLGEMTAPPA